MHLCEAHAKNSRLRDFRPARVFWFAIGVGIVPVLGLGLRRGSNTCAVLGVRHSFSEATVDFGKMETELGKLEAPVLTLRQILDRLDPKLREMQAKGSDDGADARSAERERCGYW